MAFIKDIFRDGSENEKIFYQICLNKKIQVIYEPRTDDIIKTLKGTTGTYKPTQYTPDFLLEIPSKDEKGKEFTRKILIETKGFMRGRDALIIKIADAYYTSRGYEYYCITTAGKVSSNDINYYLYSLKGIPKRGAKTYNFWEMAKLPMVTTEEYLEARKQLRSTNENKN